MGGPGDPALPFFIHPEETQDMSEQNEELIQLKEQAKTLGVQHSPNIGLDALRAKVRAKLDGTDDAGDKADGQRTPAAEDLKVETEQQIRDRLNSEALALVRCRITNLNPHKASMRGEVITVGNKYTGSISKFIPFGEATDNGYHVPKIIFDELKQRKFNSIKSEKSTNGVYRPVQRLVPEFAIEVLEPLTPEELSQLARQQAAAAGL